MTCQILAAIVLYHPDADQLARMISALHSEVARIILYRNSPIDVTTRERLEAISPDRIEWVGSGVNVGLGKAYNDCLQLADRAGCPRLVLFDQDSLPPAGMVPALDTALTGLATSPCQPVAVGPTPIGLDGRPIKAPLVRATAGTGAAETSFLISSGKMIDVAAGRRVGAFREDFFIDMIDIEWCLRARSMGYSVWMLDTVQMEHALGAGVIVLPAGVLRVTRQMPLRIYTFIRNQIVMLRLAHVPPSYKIRFVATLPVRMLTYLWVDRSAAMRRALWRGLLDGLRNRLGNPQDALR